MKAANQSGTSFLRELRRRKVIRTCLYYVIACWIVLAVGNFVFPALGLDGDQASRVLLLVALIGFPVIFLAAWRFQLSPRGVARTTSFVERRVLRNMAPINDRRHAREETDAQQGDDDKDFKWVLSAETGSLTGLSFGIAKTVQLGTSLDCDIAVVSPHVSTEHARLQLKDGALLVEDLGSANGTVVNGKKISGPHRLHHEDELRLHDVIFRVMESYASKPMQQDTLTEATEVDTAQPAMDAANDPTEPLTPGPDTDKR